MRNVIIAPTATYKRKGDRIDIVDTLKQSPDSIVVTHKPNTIMPKGVIKANAEIRQKTWFDMQIMKSNDARNRRRALEVYDYDYLYETRPMCGVSLPNMKLKQKDFAVDESA